PNEVVASCIVEDAKTIVFISKAWIMDHVVLDFIYMPLSELKRICIVLALSPNKDLFHDESRCDFYQWKSEGQIKRIGQNMQPDFVGSQGLVSKLHEIFLYEDTVILVSPILENT
ncbi:hypothetical protein ACJX0J_041143, partial [Zea mays]